MNRFNQGFMQYDPRYFNQMGQSLYPVQQQQQINPLMGQYPRQQQQMVQPQMQGIGMQQQGYVTPQQYYNQQIQQAQNAFISQEKMLMGLLDEFSQSDDGKQLSSLLSKFSRYVQSRVSQQGNTGQAATPQQQEPQKGQ